MFGAEGLGVLWTMVLNRGRGGIIMLSESGVLDQRDFPQTETIVCSHLPEEAHVVVVVPDVRYQGLVET